MPPVKRELEDDRLTKPTASDITAKRARMESDSQTDLSSTRTKSTVDTAGKATMSFEQYSLPIGPSQQKWLVQLMKDMKNTISPSEFIHAQVSVASNHPHYSETTNRPVNLSQMETKLKAEGCSSFIEFIGDFLWVVRHNSPFHITYYELSTRGKKLETWMKKRVSKYPYEQVTNAELEKASRKTSGAKTIPEAESQPSKQAVPKPLPSSCSGLEPRLVTPSDSETAEQVPSTPRKSVKAKPHSTASEKPAEKSSPTDNIDDEINRLEKESQDIQTKLANAKKKKLEAEVQELDTETAELEDKILSAGLEIKALEARVRDKGTQIRDWNTQRATLGQKRAVAVQKIEELGQGSNPITITGRY